MRLRVEAGGGIVSGGGVGGLWPPLRSAGLPAAAEQAATLPSFPALNHTPHSVPNIQPNPRSSIPPLTLHPAPPQTTRFARTEYLRLAVEDEPDEMQVDSGDDAWPGAGAAGDAAAMDTAAGGP